MLAMWLRKLLLPLGVYVGAILFVAVLISFSPGVHQSWYSRLFKELHTIYMLDFGRSSWNNLPIWPLIWHRLAVTISLAFGGLVFALIIGVFLGVYSGLHPSSLSARFLLFITYGVSNLPVLLLGYGLIFFFVRVYHFLPTHDQLSLLPGWQRTLAVLLPMLVLGVGDGSASEITRHVREEVTRIRTEPFIQAYQSRGLSPLPPLFRHLSTTTLVLFFSRFTYLLGGAVVIEYLFNWKGFGYQTWQAAWQQDYNFILAASIVFGGIFLLLNFLKELALSRLLGIRRTVAHVS